MAASASSVQCILSLQTTSRIEQRRRGDILLSSVTFQRQQKIGGHGNGMLAVKCMAEKELPKQPTPVSSTPPPTPRMPSSPPKVSTKFSDVLAFGGSAPERINGRLAMIGFVTAIAVELAKGDDVVHQIANGGLPWFVYISVLLSVASLVPMFSGVTVESKSKGFMTSDAEMLNGRFAMLGLVALVFTEFVNGGALV